MSEPLSCVLLLTCWILLAASFLGLGLTATRLLSVGDPTSGRGTFACIWIGLTIVVLILQLVHFFAPINRVVALTTVGVGLIPWLDHDNRKFLGQARARMTGPSRPFVVVAAAVLIGLFLSYRALGQPGAYDTGMYHLPAVEWFRSFPVVPGLANLHGRLGFNNSGFLLASFFDAALPPFRPWSIINGFFLLLLAVRALCSWVRLPDLAGGSRRAALYDLFIAPVILVLVLDPLFISSLTAEVPVAAGVFFTGRWLLEGVPGHGAVGADRHGLHVAVTTLLVLALLLTFKLSTVAWSAAGTVVLIWAWRHGLGSAGSVDIRRGFGTAVVVAFFLVGAWAVRGVVLSGYLAYPSPSTAFPVEWRAPLEQATAEQAWIKHYAHNFFYGEELAPRPPPYSFQWLVAWGSAIANDFRHRWLFFYPLLISGGLSLTMLAGRLRELVVPTSERGSERFLPVPSHHVLFAAGASLVFWFVMAPLPRLGFFLVWVVAAVLGASLLRRLTLSVRLQRVGLIGLTLAPLLTPILLDPPESIGGFSEQFARRLVDRQLRAETLPPRTDAYLRRYETDSGLEVWVPRTDNRCWDAPFPCTPHPSPNLRLRKPPDLGGGFMMEGGWTPRRWPNPDSDFLVRWRNESASR